MYFNPSITSTTLFLASAIGLTTASPLAARSTSTSYKLVYRPISGDTLPIPLKSLAHGTWAVTKSKDLSHLILAPDSPETSLIFYQYHPDGVSTATATGNTGLIVTPGGSSTVPSNNRIDLADRSATRGVAVGKAADGSPALGYKEGRWQACLVEDQEIILRYVGKGQRVFEDCMEAVLQARCMGPGHGGEIGPAQEIECYMTPF